jgi:hypothetical protein
MINMVTCKLMYKLACSLALKAINLKKKQGFKIQ